MAPQELMVRLAPQAHRDYKDFKGYLEPTEQLDLSVPQALRGYKV